MRALTIGRRIWHRDKSADGTTYRNRHDNATITRTGARWALDIPGDDSERRPYATLRDAATDAERIAPTMVTAAPAGGAFVGPDAYGYARRAAWRAVGRISGADWESVAHDIIVSALADGVNLETLSPDVRIRFMWECKSARRDAIRAAQRVATDAGEVASERAAAGGIGCGTVGPALHHLDIIDVAFERLASRDAAAHRWAVAALSGKRKRGGISTQHVIPFADRRDQDTRAGVVARALAMLGDDYRAAMGDAAAMGVSVVTDAEGIGSPARATAAPLIDVPRLARWYGWDAETRAGAAMVSAALSPADEAALYVNTDGPAGSTVPARAARVNTGARGRSGALSGAPGAGTVHGRSAQSVGGARRERLASERTHRDAMTPNDRYPLSGDVMTPSPLSREEAREREAREARDDRAAALATALARAARSDWTPERDARDAAAARAAAVRAAHDAHVLPTGETRAEYAARVAAHRAAMA